MCFESRWVLILVAMIPTTVYFMATLMVNDNLGWSQHMATLSTKTLAAGLRIVFAADIMYGLACMFAKLSIMQIVRREMSCASSFWRHLVWIATALLLSQGSISAILMLTRCGSPSSFLRTRQSACADKAGRVLAANILNMFTDVLVVLLTIPCILSYRLSRKQKAVVIAVYATGFVSFGAGIPRTYLQYRSAGQTDVTWEYYYVWLTGSCQLYLGMICTTLPSTRHFFTYYFPSLFGELSSDDDDIAPERVESICSGSTSITEKSIDSEKGTCRSTSSTGMYIENLGGVITIGTVDRRLLMEGDKDFIKITQQTVVEISSAWE